MRPDFGSPGFIFCLVAGLTHSIVAFRQPEATGQQVTDYIPGTSCGQGGTR